MSLILAGGVLQAPAAAPATLPVAAVVAPAVALVPADSVAVQRPRAVEMGEAYHTRLVIHHVASYAIVPLFVTQYLLGTKLYNNPPGSEATRHAHRYVALGVEGLFAVNTVTGVWNLWASRKQPEGRLLRWLHGGLMLAADAGFVTSGLIAPRPWNTTPERRSLHRTVALSSMGVALASYGIMLIWRH